MVEVPLPGPRAVFWMIQSGTSPIRKGTILPSSILLKSSVRDGGSSAVQGGADLLESTAELAQAGWTYFYMGAVKQTVFGRGPKRIASAMNGVAAKVRLNKCNSLQIDAITPQSVLGIPYLSVSAHCCHIQQGVIFAGEKQ
jgi:hypothetical protein